MTETILVTSAAETVGSALVRELDGADLAVRAGVYSLETTETTGTGVTDDAEAEQ